MSKIRNKRMEAQQLLQESKVKKNAKIISVLFWFGSSLYIYSTDVGFADVYSWKPFVFFVLGPLFSAIVFGNIIYSLQKIIEKLLIKSLADTKPELIPPLIVVIFFCVLIGTFLIIFEFAKMLQILLH
ncbi:MAG: hypothetical protein HN640_00835 [Gammaproteobacteria bacterium]|jgi:hypothetical protein|nr:hypothetical protein [Gammaproteobacteria bacterium]MBT4463002.1 hypothetical protein [Gammaproteobacteria bacterium]MBT4654575.1 hypothetical protein [Gammaproteobacteria bacterium]MBT5117113.1 hypothetical protein [Gammaproteobacteria bacterium]MBT6331138.1 hypothetical protein [Gammaproteobacteria bacterium]